jgi:hypothetical protein
MPSPLLSFFSGRLGGRRTTAVVAIAGIAPLVAVGALGAVLAR